MAHGYATEEFEVRIFFLFCSFFWEMLKESNDV
jgi:hypothetical protein